MKVLHIGLVSHFTDKMLYQDNVLAEMNAKAGHEVTYISDAACYCSGKLIDTEECDVILDNGVRLIRIKYDFILNSFITNKIQKAKKLVSYLEEIRPDTILYHSTCGYELMDVARYVEKNKIPFYIDSHANFYNTALTQLSKFAYKYIHGYFLQKALPYAKRILYIGLAEKQYLQEMYRLPEDRLEYFPLGGIILEEAKRREYRTDIQKKMQFPDDVIICAHSGKLDKGKKTEQVLQAFAKVQSNCLRLLIFGAIPEYMKPILQPLIDKDERVFFLGWKTKKEQEEILGACDLYLQPGTGSATAQIALCNGCALLVDETLYKHGMKDAVFYGSGASDIEILLNMIIQDRSVLNDMQSRGRALANKLLNYENLACRYLK